MLPKIGLFIEFIAIIIDQAITHSSIIDNRQIITFEGINDSNGIIRNNNVTNEWLFINNFTNFIRLKFIKINLQCNDSIYVFKGDSFEQELITRINGPYGRSEQLKPIYCENNRLLLIFQSQQSIIDDESSFELQYSFESNNNETLMINNNNNEWIKFEQNFFLPRVLHTSIYDHISDQIYIYGGRNHEQIYSDLLSYSFRTNKWYNFTSITDCDNVENFDEINQKPRSRWGHTMNFFQNDTLIIFGGIGDDGEQFNDLWSFNLITNKWTEHLSLNRIDENTLPKLAFHIALIIDHEWLYIHGGRLNNSSYSSNIYRVNLFNYSHIELISPSNSNNEIKLAAHTAIFNNRSIIVFGGFDEQISLQNSFYEFNVDTRIWSIINVQSNKPSKRAFHSMQLISDHYLLILGGFTNDENYNDGNKFHIFSFKHSKWLQIDSNISNEFPYESIYLHSMLIRKNFIYIIGGYYGQISNEILFYKLNSIDIDSSFELNQWENARKMPTTNKCLNRNTKQSIFRFIHPLGSQTYAHNRLRMYLNHSMGKLSSINLNDKYFIDQEFINHIVKQPIRPVKIDHRIEKRQINCNSGYYSHQNECIVCNCNGHGDPQLGICNSQTGECYCTNNTAGYNCEYCSQGFYGDPINNGVCFRQCYQKQNKILILNATVGYFGHQKRKTNGNYCLWIISTNDNVNLSDAIDQKRNSLRITIHRSPENSNCSQNSLIIYDGIASHSSHGNYNTSHIIASICIGNNADEHQFIASTGVATILYKQSFSDNQSNQAFNATYQSIDRSSLINQSFINRKLPQYQCNIEYFDNFIIFIGGYIDVKHLSVTLYSLANSELVALQNHLHIAPTNRHLHSTTRVHQAIFIYGGIDLLTNKISHEFWCLNITHSGELLDFNWLNLTVSNNDDKVLPPALMGHTLTAIKRNTSFEFDSFILIGGYSPENGYNYEQYIYSLNNKQWSLLIARGSSPLGIIGHSTVYYNDILYTFGGIDFKESHKMTVSNTLYILDCKTLIWKRIQPRSVLNSITPLYLHQAITMQNYMLIIGGKKSMKNYHQKDEKSILTYAYFYKCNRWIAIMNVSSIYNHSILTDDYYQQQFVSITMDRSINKFFMYNHSNRFKSIILPDDFCKFFTGDRQKCLAIDGCAYCHARNQSICFDPELNSIDDCIEIVNSPSSDKCVYSANPINKIKNKCHQFTNCIDCTVNNYELDNNFNDAEYSGCQWCADCHMANGQCIPMNDSCQWLDYFDNINENNYLSSNTLTTASPICSNISIVHDQYCLQRRCMATDCRKCLNLNKNRNLYGHHDQSDDCIWTKQVYKFIKFGQLQSPRSASTLTILMNPIFDWACIESSIIKFSIMKNIPTIPPLKCPRNCYEYKTCKTCTNNMATGNENDSYKCVWSDLHRECMKPEYAAIKCQFTNDCGGFLIDDNHHHNQQCSEECQQFKKASDCVQMLDCGWCSIDNLSNHTSNYTDGLGLCLQGNIIGPENKSLCSIIENNTIRTRWYFAEIPKENECMNNHHNCDLKSQICIDLDDGFMCQCKSGYKIMFDNDNDSNEITSNKCKPICQQGCANGYCIEPNICKCNFGYIGDDCSIKCHCNGHSICPSIDKRNVCVECHNNTQGPNCNECQLFFVHRNLTKDTFECQSCYEYCNNHTDICFNESDLYNMTTGSINNHFDDNFWHEYGRQNIKHGSFETKTTATFCMNCKNNTEGERCDRCKLGYFKISDDIRDGCRQCMCNDHGNICNPFNGENCNCNNNTENDRQCNYNLNTKEYYNYINKTYYFKSSQIMTTYSLPCWMLQCTKCKDYYYGQPINGHQCYRHMFIDKEYCLNTNFDNKNNNNDNNDCIDYFNTNQQSPLLYGRTLFYAIQPRYMNVDIRLIIYSIDGKIDLFVTLKDDFFIIKVDKSNGFHRLFVDKKYLQFANQSSNDSVQINETSINDLLINHQFVNNQTIRLKSPYKFTNIDLMADHHRSSNTLLQSSYITMQNWYEILILRNVSNRLELTIPYRYHDLRTTRYYMIIYGGLWAQSFENNDSTINNENYAYLVLRQDQNRIDLFIFFCIFLSCFFIFLSLSIIGWRIKQFIYLTHVRHLQEIELQFMANRPFSMITIRFDNDNNCDNEIIFRPSYYNDDEGPSLPRIQSQINQKSSNSNTKYSFFSKLSIFNKNGDNNPTSSMIRESPRKIFPIHSNQSVVIKQNRSMINPTANIPMPVSIELTNDNLAAIYTTFIRLPHKSNEMIKMAAASTLISMKNCANIVEKFENLK